MNFRVGDKVRAKSSICPRDTIDNVQVWLTEHHVERLNSIKRLTISDIKDDCGFGKYAKFEELSTVLNLEDIEHILTIETTEEDL